MMNTTKLPELADKISTNDLWQWHEDLAKYGGAKDVVKDGVSRLALSEEELETKIELINWSKARGYHVYSDAMANLYIRRDGKKDVPAVATGSHIDSQIEGGRYDGMFGVLAGLTCLDAFDKLNIETEKPLVVVAWTNEEGSRFMPGAMGSRYFSGKKTVADFADSRDVDGKILSDVLSENLKLLSGHTEVLEATPSLDCYIEAHIEQGPILEQMGTSIGAVTGVQGTHWFEVVIEGNSAHAGTTPLANRQDAVVAALEIMQRIREEVADPKDIVRLTFGRIEVTPNSPNTVANRVFFTIDLRHPDRETLSKFSNTIEAICENYSGSCRVECCKVMDQDPCVFPEAMVRAVEQSAEALSISSMRLPSGAFHDALFLAEVCPTSMVFIPCQKGISHNPAEYSEPEQLANGTRVLAATLLHLAKESQLEQLGSSK